MTKLCTQSTNQGDAHAFPDRLRVFSRKRENIGQVWLEQIKGRAKVIALGPKESEDRSDSEADGLRGF
jgi:hypothetical protein